MPQRRERANLKPSAQPTAQPDGNDATPWPPAGIRPHKRFLLVAAVLFFVWNALLVWLWLRG